MLFLGDYISKSFIPRKFTSQKMSVWRNVLEEVRKANLSKKQGLPPGHWVTVSLQPLPGNSQSVDGTVACEFQNPLPHSQGGTMPSAEGCPKHHMSNGSKELTQRSHMLLMSQSPPPPWTRTLSLEILLKVKCGRRHGLESLSWELGSWCSRQGSSHSLSL